jgi:hypothetical protein
MMGDVDNGPAHHQIAGIRGNQLNQGRRVGKMSNLPDKTRQQFGVFKKQ